MIVKQFTNYSVNPQGEITNVHTGHKITPVYKNGYAQVRLSNNGKVTNKSLHRVVYETLVGEIPPGMHINHINGIRSDNRIDNLEMCTPKENNDRRVFLKRGSDVNTSKLNGEQVINIRHLGASGLNNRQIADLYGLNKSSVRRIILGLAWSHLPTMPYDDKWSDPVYTGSISGKALKSKYGDDYFSRIARGEKVKSDS